MILLKGEKLANKILGSLKREIKSRHLKLRLAVVLVGENSASKIFIREKASACKKLNVGFKLYNFREKISQQKFEKAVKEVAADSENSGIVIQLPLPKKFNTQKILNLVPGKKDVDILSEKNFKKFSKGKISLLPPTVGAILALLKEYKISLKNKHVIVVGAGRLVGGPLAAWLKLRKINFLILDKKTKNISPFTKKADILITGVGRPDLIAGDMVKPGVVVIDAGTSRKNGKTVGDINFRSVSKKASCITPPIGGAGPLTVACLLYNLVKLSEQ